VIDDTMAERLERLLEEFWYLPAFLVRKAVGNPDAAVLSICWVQHSDVVQQALPIPLPEDAPAHWRQN
jgi:hypothetical protein